uniref:Uncharacterized protein n=1 Tax=Buteo japonicus TaxID=224669 RepID=A0A8C0BQF2_9AVES
ALAEAALSAPLAAPSLCCGAVILVPAMELHGEGSSNFPYIASVMRQLQGGGSGMSCLSFSLVAIPDRFSATKDLASNACILIIASACHEDNGNYYCALSHAFNWF